MKYTETMKYQDQEALTGIGFINHGQCFCSKYCTWSRGLNKEAS